MYVCALYVSEGVLSSIIHKTKTVFPTHVPTLSFKFSLILSIERKIINEEKGRILIRS